MPHVHGGIDPWHAALGFMFVSVSGAIILVMWRTKRVEGAGQKEHMRVKIALGLLALLCLLTFVRAEDDHNAAKQLKDAGAIVPLAQILATVGTAYPGRVLEVELRDMDGRRVYQVELVDTHGVVWYLHFDAIQGTLLHRRKEKVP
jgi:uncharacterized membrane protein YkoI